MQEFGVVWLRLEGSLDTYLDLKNPPRANLAEYGIADRGESPIEFIFCDGRSRLATVHLGFRMDFPWQL